MSAFSGRPQYDDPLSEEDEAVADSGTDLAYRRLAAPSGETAGTTWWFSQPEPPPKFAAARINVVPRCSRRVWRNADRKNL